MKNMTKKEEWKDIKGFEGSYQVSSLGRILGKERLVWNKANQSYSRLKGGIRRPDKTRNDYDQIGLCQLYVIKIGNTYHE